MFDTVLELAYTYRRKEDGMARSDARYSVYPASKAIEVIGTSAPALNQAIECWAALLLRATADNAKTFYWNEEGVSGGSLNGKWEDMHELRPWGLLAEVLKGRRFDPDFANPGALLATAVEDAHRMEDAAEKWFSSEFDGEQRSRGLEHSVAALTKKLRDLDYAHAWAVIVAVEWFWDHQADGIDIKKDPWWSLVFRRQWHAKHSRRGGPIASTKEPKVKKKSEPR
jgi:hypothetical protein